jgi:hypothetical protein
MTHSMRCDSGHLHLALPCQKCGGTHPTNVVLPEPPPVGRVHIIDSVFDGVIDGVSDSRSAVSVGGSGWEVTGRNLTFRNVPTAFKARQGEGEPRLLLDGIDYEASTYRPPRRERRKKRKR